MTGLGTATIAPQSTVKIGVYLKGITSIIRSRFLA